MIGFASPWLLLGLLVVPAVIAGHWLAQKRSKGSVRFSEVRLLKGIKASAAVRARHLPFALRVLALALLVVAFARPRSGATQEEITTRGIDIVVAVDNSTSMAAEDFKPKNRLAVAKDAVARFIKGRGNDRIGLVIFAGRGYTRCPLTLDYDILEELLNQRCLAGPASAVDDDRLARSQCFSEVIKLLLYNVHKENSGV